MRQWMAALVGLTLSAPAFAGEYVCTATPDDGRPVINFTMNYEPDGTTMYFDQEIAWYDEARVFKVVYSGYFGDTHLVVGASVPGPRQQQFVELHFDAANGGMEKGILRAGDRNEIMAYLAKYREYALACK